MDFLILSCYNINNLIFKLTMLCSVQMMEAV